MKEVLFVYMWVKKISLRGLYFQLKPFICVDNFCSVSFLLTRYVVSVVEMYMAVNEVFWLILIDEICETLESSVCNIISVSAAGCRCMGQHNVDSTGTANLPVELAPNLKQGSTWGQYSDASS